MQKYDQPRKRVKKVKKERMGGGRLNLKKGSNKYIRGLHSTGRVWSILLTM